MEVCEEFISDLWDDFPDYEPPYWWQEIPPSELFGDCETEE